MNERFYTLPTEKQQAIINAGYRVFSQNSYKNSPMSEIAAEAGISKSLLFHYFHRFDKEATPFRGDFVMWLEIILIFPFFVFRKTEMF